MGANTSPFYRQDSIINQAFQDGLRGSPLSGDEPDDDPDDPLQQQLDSTQAAHKKISDWLSTFHGAEPEEAGNLRQQVARGKISGSDYYAMTGRIYSSPNADRKGGGLTTGSLSKGGLDALDNFQYRQANQMGSDEPSGGDAFAGGLGHTPLPGSVAARVGPPSPGMMAAGSTASFNPSFFDPRPSGQYGKAGEAGSTRVFGPVAPGTANQVTSVSLPRSVWG